VAGRSLGQPTRRLHTAQTGDVMSKSAAGAWAIEVLPEHRALVEHAMAVREDPTSEPDTREILAETAEFLNEVIHLVAATGESTI